MINSNLRFRRSAALCGLISPIISLGTILISVVMIADFSWQANDLSDMGVSATPNLFNFGLIATGLLSGIFALGVARWIGSDRSARIGSAALIIGSFDVAAIGVITEAYGPVHFWVSAAYFVLVPIGYIFLSRNLWRKGKKIASRLSIAAGLTVLIMMALRKVLTHDGGVAVPETLSAMITNAWTFGLALMLWLEA
jgi:hypothetical membrane protein